MSYDSEIIRKLLFVKKCLSNEIDILHPCKMKESSLSDQEPVFPKILRETMISGCKLKKTGTRLIFSINFVNTFDDTCVYMVIPFLQLWIV